MAGPHITICVCTFKRSHLLERALGTLCTQDTNGLFTYSLVVVDNDAAESGRAMVEAVASRSPVPVKYCVEPRQNIALARNKAVENATGDFVAFIDDDELAPKGWLLALFTTWQEHKVDGVLGPVRPHFDEGAPSWVVKGGFYARPELPTGMRLEWGQCRTGNVLLRSALFEGLAQPFNPEFLSGEDQDFFKRMIAAGRAFVWCTEAAAYEVIPPSRWKRGFLVRRAIFRGVFSHRNRRSSPLPVAYSMLVAPAYVVALPIGLVMGQATFMSWVFSLSYHLGRLMAAVGVNPIRQPYVTD
jgi:glycosyltransferase involved in cell wall biosynthesis